MADFPEVVRLRPDTAMFVGTPGQTNSLERMLQEASPGGRLATAEDFANNPELQNLMRRTFAGIDRREAERQALPIPQSSFFDRPSEQTILTFLGQLASRADEPATLGRGLPVFLAVLASVVSERSERTAKFLVTAACQAVQHFSQAMVKVGLPVGTACEAQPAFAALDAVIKAALEISQARYRDFISKGGRLFGVAVKAIAASAKTWPNHKRKDFISFFATDLLTSRWKVEGCWNDCNGVTTDDNRGYGGLGPLSAAVYEGDEELVELALSKGASPSGKSVLPAWSTPLWCAYQERRPKLLKRLLEAGASVTQPYVCKPFDTPRPLPFCLDYIPYKLDDDDDTVVDQMSTIIYNWPGVAQLTLADGGKEDSLVNWVARIHEDSLRFVPLLLRAGTPVSFGHAAKRIGRETVTSFSLLLQPLRRRRKEDLELLKLLIDPAGEFRLLEDWERRYSEYGKAELANELGNCFFDAFPHMSAEKARGAPATPESKLTEPQRICWRVGELFLTSGFTHTLGTNGVQSVWGVFYREPPKLNIAEGDAIRVARRYRSAGADIKVNSLAIPGTRFSARMDLAQCVAPGGLKDLVNVAIEEIGCDVNACIHPPRGSSSTQPVNLLACSVLLGATDGELCKYLLKRYNLSPIYSCCTAQDQPILRMFGGKLSDQEVASVISAMAEVMPSILQHPIWKVGIIPAASAKVPAPNPMAQAAAVGLNKALEAVCRLPGADAMARQPVLSRDIVLASSPRTFATSGSRLLFVTPAQVCAIFKDWEGLGILMRHCNLSFTTTTHGTSRSVADLVEDALSGKGNGKTVIAGGEPPPRTLVALVRSKAAAELAGTKAADATTAAAVTTTSNAFEDPSVKVLTAAEEKKKAKKRAAKKKAKEKKKAAQEATTGAGGAAADETSDSDSSGPEETDEEEHEPGTEHLVDSRNAPDLTVMLAARRAARAKEAAAEEEEARKKQSTPGEVSTPAAPAATPATTVTAATTPGVADSRPVAATRVAIEKYGWADGAKAVSVYVDYDGLEALPEDACQVTSDDTSFELTIAKRSADCTAETRHTLKLGPLAHEITGVTVKRKPSSVVLRLAKKETSQAWPQLLKGRR
jgi:hypothetical protein